MWPWGHAAVAYLAYRVGRDVDDGHAHGVPTIAAVVGSQVPDLVDKPLAWWVDVLPTGRTLAHSGIAWLLVTGVLLAIVARRWRSAAFAFSLGYGTHLLTDALYPILNAEWGELAYLLWPILPSPEYPTEQSFGAHFAQLQLISTTVFELGLFVGALGWAVYTEFSRPRSFLWRFLDRVRG
jgi:hypothetical protein